jgi:hypothetical protein
VLVIEDFQELKFPMERFNVRSAGVGDRLSEPRLSSELREVPRLGHKLYGLLELGFRELRIHKSGSPQIGHHSERFAPALQCRIQPLLVFDLFDRLRRRRFNVSQRLEQNR